MTDYLSENGLTAKQLLKDKAATQKMFEQYTKASHEAVEKQFDAWTKQKLERVKANNAKAGDIGAGGGTPAAAPKKYKSMFREIPDEAIAELNS